MRATNEQLTATDQSVHLETKLVGREMRHTAWRRNGAGNLEPAQSPENSS